MTQIDFFSNAPDRLDYVVRLLTRVQQKNQTAVVFAPQAQLLRLSAQLWQAPGFLAHDVQGEEAAFTPRAPFVLIHTPLTDYPHHSVLINLADEVPTFFAQFERLIEVVPNQDAPKQAARERWQYYKNLGYPLAHHDIAVKRVVAR